MLYSILLYIVTIYAIDLQIHSDSCGTDTYTTIQTYTGTATGSVSVTLTINDPYNNGIQLIANSCGSNCDTILRLKDESGTTLEECDYNCGNFCGLQAAISTSEPLYDGVYTLYLLNCNMDYQLSIKCKLEPPTTTTTVPPTTTLYYPKNTVTEGSIECGTVTEGYTTYPTEIANYTLTVYNQCKEGSPMRLHIDLCNTQFNNPFIYLWEVDGDWSRVQKSNALMDCKHGDYENMVSINWYLYDGEYILGIGSIAHVSSRSVPYEFGHYFMNITCKMFGCGAQETTTILPSVTEDHNIGMQNGSDNNDATIIGGSISGFVILLLVTIFLVYYFCFKNRNAKKESFLQENKINITECIKNSDQVVSDELPTNWEGIQTKDQSIIIESNANKTEMIVQQVVIPVEVNENKSSDNIPATIINTNTVKPESNEKSDKISCEDDMEGNNENEIKNETHVEPVQVADTGRTEMPSTISDSNVNKIENNDQVVMHQDVYNLLVNDVHIANDMKMKYFNLFIENGFDTLDSIKTFTNQDLIDIGIDKLGHRKMILSASEQL